MTINFPVFESITVEDYGLYPGVGGRGGLHFDFAVDENLVLGVNGLGKSTLLLLLKHMIEGPVRARAPGFVGASQPDLMTGDIGMFAVRSADGAPQARATLTINVGGTTVVISRKLRDLSLQSLSVQPSTAAHATSVDPAHYRATFADLIGVQAFSDAVLICDRVVFFLENRERLLWDWRTQYEVFGSVLLPGADVAEMRKLERTTVSSDSSARNLSAAMFKASGRRTKELRKHDKAKSVSATLDEVETDLEKIIAREVELVGLLDQRRNDVADARARHWRAQSDVDSAAARYDHLKYSAIRHAIGNASGEVQYALLKLLEDGHCLVCDTRGLSGQSELLAQRQKSQHCLLCGTQRAPDPGITTTSGVLTQQAEDSYSELDTLRGASERARSSVQSAQKNEEEVAEELRNVRDEVDVLQRSRRRLRSELPTADRASLARVESELEELSSTVEAYERDREEAEGKLDDLIARVREGVLAHRDRIEAVFSERAKDFFIENVRLVYVPRNERISQSSKGRRFDFPAFEVELTSGSTGDTFVRRSYDQASLSQREYLDIAFRMAVMEAFGSGTCSIVVDGPEGSVDVVFSERAGKMLANYAHPGAGSAMSAAGGATHQIIVACNVVEGGFIPWYFRDHPSIDDRRNRTINLLDIAHPTAALSQLRPDYVEKVEQVLARRATP